MAAVSNLNDDGAVVIGDGAAGARGNDLWRKFIGLGAPSLWHSAGRSRFAHPETKGDL